MDKGALSYFVLYIYLKIFALQLYIIFIYGSNLWTKLNIYNEYFNSS